MAQERSLPLAQPANHGELTPLGDASDPRIATEPTIPIRPIRRKRRWLRILLITLLVPLVLIGLTIAAIAINPSLLLPLGNILLGNQPGAVAWNGHDPLNILVMGIDQRATEPTRTDTLIVLHIDPSSNDVKMLSVPRDLWVSIPLFTAPGAGDKINQAYTDGDQYHQGPQMSQLTVESDLGIAINYYAVVKFAGFKKIVDALGGVNVCVTQPIHDDHYPDDVGYGWHTVDFAAGCQQMDGARALVYVRERHAYVQEDLGRIQAQQALLTGIEKGLLSVGTLFRLPAITSAANEAIITNLPHGSLLYLGMLLGRARGEHTQHLYLNQDGGYVQNGAVGDAAALLPNWPKIHGLIATQFADPRLQAEHAQIQVQDGQHTASLGTIYTAMLQGAGFNTVPPRKAAKNTYARDQVIVNTDRPGADYTVRKLAQMLQADVGARAMGASAPGIVVILGANAGGGA